MNNLALVKSENFGDVKCDFWEVDEKILIACFAGKVKDLKKYLRRLLDEQSC